MQCFSAHFHRGSHLGSIRSTIGPPAQHHTPHAIATDPEVLHIVEWHTKLQPKYSERLLESSSSSDKQTIPGLQALFFVVWLTLNRQVERIQDDVEIGSGESLKLGMRDRKIGDHLVGVGVVEGHETPIGLAGHGVEGLGHIVVIAGVLTGTDLVEVGMDNIQTSIHVVNAFVDTVDSGSSGIESVINFVHPGSCGIESAIDTIESVINAIESAIDAIQTTVDACNALGDNIERGHDLAVALDDGNVVEVLDFICKHVETLAHATKVGRRSLGLLSVVHLAVSRIGGLVGSMFCR